MSITERGDIVIVGGSSGLGLTTARRLAVDGRRVVVTGRKFTAVTAADRRAGILPLELDLSTLAGASAITERLSAAGVATISALLLNAGQQGGRRVISPDGFEATMAVNVLAPMVILDAMAQRLAPGARVVWSASGTHNPDEVRMITPELEQATLGELVHPTGEFRMRDGLRWYAASKLCVVRLVPELARRLAPASIRVNAFDPGLMPLTGLARGYPSAVRAAYRWAGPALLLTPGAHRVGTSAKHLASLVTDPRFATMSGAYVVDTAPAGTSVAAHDVTAAARLYSEVRQMVALSHLPA